MWTIPTGILQHRSYDCRYPRYILPKDRFQRLRKGMKILEAVRGFRGGLICPSPFSLPCRQCNRGARGTIQILLYTRWRRRSSCGASCCPLFGFCKKIAREPSKMSQTRSHLPSGKKRGSLRPEFSEWGEACSLQAMDNRGPVSSALPDPRCSVSEISSYGDEELDEETVNFISALYAALGPLLPEVTQLQGHQDPPAHLMIDMKAKLRELGSSVSDARKRLLRYNIYLKKKLAKAIQEKRAWREQQLRPGELGAEQVGHPWSSLQPFLVDSTSSLQCPSPSYSFFHQPSPPQTPRGVRTEMESGKSSMGTEKNMQDTPAPEFPRIKPPERFHRRSDTADDHSRGSMTPQGVLQRSAGKTDTMSSRPSPDRGQ
ncbi:uncharacterized protein LOC121924169 isoform X1 [Sceloporus undulatus]|uniref:uncharacterized protein LOC121924169 isoform X1 n=2 Tax=Sceloporus undulatus TaxID=8520 RepID=UPI001C4D146A|nr:uncharacterized protein LOC121924169 isoform X1 [Sceloporus undulatus]